MGTELALRLELAEAAGTAAYAASQRRVDPAANATALAIEPGPAYAVYAGPGSPVGRAIGLGMYGPVNAEVIEQVEAFFAAHGASARVDVCPLADDSLWRGLSVRGYVLAGMKQVLVMPMAAWRGRGAAGADSAGRISVRPIQPGEEQTWVETVSRGFRGEGEPTEFDRSISRPSVGQEGATCFLALVDGEPAGGGVIEIRDGLALLRTTATILRFRGCGVQTELIAARLEFARQAGCELATVQTGPGTASQRNVERAGFRVAYTKPTMAQAGGMG